MAFWEGHVRGDTELESEDVNLLLLLLFNFEYFDSGAPHQGPAGE